MNRTVTIEQHHLYTTNPTALGPNQCWSVFTLSSQEDAIAKATRERGGIIYKLVPVARVSTETRVEPIPECP